ncbi:MAG: tandem-95 repeat protein, partial [Planctomycetales bacterium]|nr:tandem-95 repeat protein [Planctomycetales bacterium]
SNITVNEDAPASVVDLFAAFADVDDADANLTFTVSANSNPSLVSTAINAGTGLLSLTYGADAFGVANLTVTATDPGGAVGTASFVVTVNPVNDAPTTTGIADQTLLEDSSPATIDLLPSFADAEDAAANLVYSVTNNTNGSVASATIATGTGQLTLMPAPNAFGSTSVTVRATDLNGAFVETTFQVDVTAVNDAPSGAISNITVNEDAPASVVDLFAAFADVDDTDANLTFTVSVNSNPSLVSTAINAGTGLLSLTYGADAFGVANLTVTATDPGGAVGTASFVVNVNPVNDAPVSNGIADVTVLEDAAPTVIDLHAVFDDIEDADPSLTFTVISNSASSVATATLTGGLLTLQFGPEQFGAGVVTIRATDTGGLFVEDTFNLNVSSVNDLPTGGIADLSLPEDSAPVAIDLWAAFDDIETADAALTFAVVGNTNPSLVTTSVNNATGQLGLSFAAGASGASSVDVQVTDSDGGVFVETFVVSINDVNDAPIGVNQAITVQEDAAPLSVDLHTLFADPDHTDAELAYSIVGQSIGGIAWAAIDAADQLHINLLPNQSGAGQITVRATDPLGLSADAVIDLTVGSVNDVPVFSPTSAILIVHGGSRAVDLSSLFHDVDHADSQLTWQVSANSNPGLVGTTVGAAGHLQISAANAVGTATLTVQAVDPLGAVGQGTLHVAVFNQPPVAHGESVLLFDRDWTFTTHQLLANDTDDDGDTLALTILTGPSHGTLTVALDGSLTYVPDAGFTGDDTISYQVTDGIDSSVATLRLQVPAAPPGNPPPEPEPTEITIEPEEQVTEETNDATSVAPGLATTLQEDDDQGAAVYQQLLRAERRPESQFISLESNVASETLDVSNIDTLLGRYSQHQRVGEALRVETASETATATGAIAPEISYFAAHTGMWGELDKAHDKMVSQAETRTLVIGTSAVAGSVLTVTYVMWLARGGYMLSTLLAQLPAWRLIDPLPILDRLSVSIDDDVSLEEMLDDANEQDDAAFAETLSTTTP